MLGCRAGDEGMEGTSHSRRCMEAVDLCVRTKLTVSRLVKKQLSYSVIIAGFTFLPYSI